MSDGVHVQRVLLKWIAKHQGGNRRGHVETLVNRTEPLWTLAEDAPDNPADEIIEHLTRVLVLVTMGRIHDDLRVARKAADMYLLFEYIADLLVDENFHDSNYKTRIKRRQRFAPRPDEPAGAFEAGLL